MVGGNKPFKYFRMSQISKMDWIRDGDHKTIIFHYSIRYRNNISRISAINNSGGDWLTDPGEVIKEFTMYYEDLLGTPIENKLKACKSIINQGEFFPESSRIG